MKSMIALWRREFLEHRGAFLFGPAILLAILMTGLLVALFTNRLEPPFPIAVNLSLKAYEVGLLVMSHAWWFYLMIALGFYFADAFAADRRNNAMFFWKSMPVSDFRVLMSKMTAAMTVFPALNIAILVASGVLLYALSLLAGLIVPRMNPAALTDVLTGSVNIIGFAALAIGLGLLWYAPFFAWIGLLATIFGRWSIPLAALVPVVVSALENAMFWGQGGPQGGHVLNFFLWRVRFGGAENSEDTWIRAVLSPGRVDTELLRTDLLAAMDWTQVGGGLVVTVIFVYLASEYRRRVIVG